MSSEIKIFQSITTEDALQELEAESKTYEGLYVDMENAPERRYVKDKAVLISGMLKKLDRARIDETKKFKMLVEVEATGIKDRLEEANKPFTLLIDGHKAKRAKEIAIKKLMEEQREAAAQKLIDHDNAIMEDKVRTFEIAEAKHRQEEINRQLKEEGAKEAREKAERDAQDAVDAAERQAVEAGEREERAKQEAQEAIHRAEIEAIKTKEREELALRQAKYDAELAAENARKEEIERQKQIEAHALAEQAKRESDQDHKRQVNNAILRVLIGSGLSENHAMTVIKLTARNRLPNMQINY
jgi:hypothetical protein